MSRGFHWGREILSLLFMLTGATICAAGIEGFLIPNGFVDGGVTGISMLLSQVTGFSLAFFLVLVNLPFLLIAKKQIGLAFAIKSAFAIAIMALLVEFLPFPSVTQDKLLGSMFGGVFIGAGVGLAMRSGSVLDGTEMLAVVLSRRSFATVGEIILAMNVIIFAIAAIRLGVEPAMYSVLTYFTASKTIDFLLHGVEANVGVLIVSQKNEAIKRSIIKELRRGVTTFRAQGGYSETDQDVVFTVITRMEITKLEGLVKSEDESAFMVSLPILDTAGGVVKRQGFH